MQMVLKLSFSDNKVQLQGVGKVDNLYLLSQKKQVAINKFYYIESKISFL
jgi:hypothetical protein